MVSVAAGAGAAAHPRVSGENVITGASLTNSSGSSPRERGKRLLDLWSQIYLRLIPA